MSLPLPLFIKYILSNPIYLYDGKTKKNLVYPKYSVIFAHAKTESLCLYCGMEQLVARWAHNPKVVCSSQAPATKSKTVRKQHSDGFHFRCMINF